MSTHVADAASADFADEAAAVVAVLTAAAPICRGRQCRRRTMLCSGPRITSRTISPSPTSPGTPT